LDPQVTVGLPVYKAEAYLAQCLESIKAQTLQDFEVVAVLDCPTDRSEEILRKHADSRFRIVENERNRGAAYSINRTIELAATPLLARMDADDIMHPFRLERQVKFLNEHSDVAAVGSYAEKIDEQGDRIENAFTLPVTPEEIRETFRLYVCFIHGSATFRVDALRSVSGFDLVLAEDLHMSFKLLAQGYRLANIPETLLSYRIHAKSTTFAVEEPTLQAADDAYRIYGPLIWGDSAPDYVGGRTRWQRLRRRIKRNLKSIVS
jgi:glycosyltransferase involved in cell wall biosynthesis